MPTRIFTILLQRNSEGMLRNQAVHELCLLVTYYGLRADNIASVKPDYDFSSCQTLKGYTDFDKLGFTVTTNEGRSVSIYADRCGGSYSEAIIRDANGVEVFRSRTPDPELLEAYEAEQAAHPNYMPYFILQHDDYITLKASLSHSLLHKLMIFVLIMYLIGRNRSVYVAQCLRTRLQLALQLLMSRLKH
jgi:hypothetical protein